ncbi:cytochrome c oxidase subunit 4 isoform 2, mitochondrial-like [Rhopilema esculentum]|uniref:cytochrome c oxidase subunit 4 isoform 2, mitochondrial-like n=1 Tax=Rhopilema esculentum TaxID=499914 RepID=UPI0031DD91A5|eukprot:gene1493-15929_t
MASLRQLSKLPVSRLATRHFSLASRSSAYIRVDPTPYERVEADSSLSALLAKEKGPWSALTKEEKLQLYKAQFPETFKETLTGEDHTKPVVGGIAIGLAAAVLFFAFLKTYIGPEAPRTVNPEWRAASKEKRKLYRQNPITSADL